MKQMKEQVKYEMSRAWLRTYYTSLKDVTLKQIGTDGAYDPVTETYTGGSPDVEVPVKGMFRKLKKSLKDNENISNTDSMFTILQSDIVEIPTVNDSIVDSTPCTWRVVDVLEDTTNVFWNLIVRRT